MNPLLIVCALPSPGPSLISLRLPFSRALGVGRFKLRFFDGKTRFSRSAATAEACILLEFRFIGECGGDGGKEDGGGKGDSMMRTSGVVGHVCV